MLKFYPDAKLVSHVDQSFSISITLTLKGLNLLVTCKFKKKCTYIIRISNVHIFDNILKKFEEDPENSFGYMSVVAKFF